MLVIKTKRSFLSTVIILIVLISIFLPSNQVSAQKSLSLVIHYSEAVPNTDSSNYNVKLYFSVLDATGNPVLGLNSADFVLTEDTKPIGINKVETAKDIPSNLILVLDASGSMRGGGIQAAQKAASNFVDRLGSRDRVSVFSFNDSITQIVDFTADHTAVIEKIKQIEAIHNSGTCLYDALVQAIQIAGTTPAGRRAVLVMTDGVDMVSGGGPCSANKTEDVIDIATKETSSVPVYALGIGKDINEQDLKRMTTRTNGTYLGSGEISQIEDLFGKLSNSLNSEYVLEYTSNNAPGIHNLTLEANYKESKDLQARAISLPAMPTNLAITSPAQNAQVSGKFKILVSVPTKGEPIARMVFTANEKSIGEVTQASYEFEWDSTTAIQAGQSSSVSLMVIAYSAAGKELGRSEPINVIVDTSAVPQAQETPTEAAIQETPTAADDETTTSNLMLYGGIALAVITVAVSGFLFYKSRSKQKPSVGDEPFELGGSTGKTPSGTSGLDGRTSEELVIGGLVSLKIKKAKDPNMVGSSYYITKAQTYVGTSADCDLVFGQGTGVSRRHVIIESKNGEFLLREGVSPDGARPTYGTYVDGRKIDQSSEPIRLMNGMTIRLGNLTELEYTNHSSAGNGQKTFEEINVAQLKKDTTEIKRD